jgi:hypothetical protein
VVHLTFLAWGLALGALAGTLLRIRGVLRRLP